MGKTCWGGFYYDNYSCYNLPGDYDESGYLSYSPSTTNSEEIINELSTLLTAGRLSDVNKNIIKGMFDAQEDKSAAFMMAQQLIVTSPEFHTTGAVVQRSGLSRPVPTPPQTSQEPYKAVVFILLSGGFDSHNMLVPQCGTLKEQYKTKRDNLALQDWELTGNITTNNQPCSEFAIHNKLPILKDLYDSQDLLFFANTGPLDKPWDKTTYYKSTLELFGHNTMQDAVQKLDYASLSIGTGVLGRIAGALSTTGATSGNPYQVGTISLQDFSYALVGKPGIGPVQTVVGSNGNSKFDPYPWSSHHQYWDVDLEPHMYSLNNATTLGTSLYGEIWSSKFLHAIDENKFLEDTLKNVNPSTYFQNEDLSNKLKQISKLTKTSESRGVDRDLFYANYGGWDHHSYMKDNIRTKFERLNAAITSFWNEMKAQNKEDQVTLIITSDFGRTMTPNSQEGSDHGWGGHYFMLGGGVKGGQILGHFPDDLDGPYVENSRGRYIPTTSWDSIWYGISQWMGVEDAAKLHEIVPGRDTEILNEEFFTKDDLFLGATSSSRRSLLRQKKQH